MEQRNLANTINFQSVKWVFFLLLFIQMAGTTMAQQLTGFWYSSDSTRRYEIKETANDKLEAVIHSSERKNDSLGYVVIKNIGYNSRKRRFEGVIYSITDSKPVFVKIRFDKNNPNIINLRLSRMLVLDVKINWIKVST